MKKLSLILATLPCFSMAKTFDIECRQHDCHQFGWIMTSPIDEPTYRNEALCRNNDCKSKGWSAVDSEGVHWEILCYPDGCFVEGYQSTQYHEGRFLTDYVHCRNNDCLTYGWDISTNYDEGGNASCTDNDCRTKGGTAFWHGRKSISICNLGDCYKNGWTWVVE